MMLLLVLHDRGIEIIMLTRGAVHILNCLQMTASRISLVLVACRRLETMVALHVWTIQVDWILDVRFVRIHEVWGG